MQHGVRGTCDTHQLPLDAQGECALCRLSAIPSKPPPSRAVPMLLVGGALITVLGLVGLAVASRSKPEPPPRGVPRAASIPNTGVDASRQASPSPAKRPRRERPTHVPVPVEPWGGRVQTAPAPPPPAPRQVEQRQFTEEQARAALDEVRIEVFVTTWCGSCRRARAYLDENGFSYSAYDIDQDAAAKDRLSSINPRRSIPTFQIDEIVQIGFSPESLEHRLNQAVRARLEAR